MKRLIALTLAGTGMMFAASFTGVVTDSGCAKADHKAMNMGTDEKCVVGCVQHGAKYMLYDGKQAYELSDQKTPEKFAAKKVTVQGTLDARTNTIKVDKIAAAQ
jgi:uncharacterized protein DUF5818